MDIAMTWLRAFAALWTSPFYYAALIFVFWQVRKQIVLERRLFSVRLHSWWGDAWRIVFWGAAAGAAATFVFFFVGAVLSPLALVLLWLIAALLTLIRVRYLCFAYAAGVLGMLQASAAWIPLEGLPEGAAMAVASIAAVHMPSVLAFVALVHAAEAMLTWKTAKRLSTPVFLEGKRGKIVGGFHLQGFWPVPMLLLVPAAGGEAGTSAGTALPWQPLLGGPIWESGWTLLAFPVVIGFSAAAISRLPMEKAKLSAGRLAGYSAIVGILAAVTELVPIGPVTFGAALLCFVLHEVVYWWGKSEEAIRSPLFVHDGRGLKVLDVIPGSPAEDLGIVSGDVIYKVNGLRIYDRAGFHEAMRLNAAFTKLEVLNGDGESKFLQRALYADEHHALGLVLCPDDDVLFYAAPVESGLLAFLSARRAAKRERMAETLENASDSTVRM